MVGLPPIQQSEAGGMGGGPPNDFVHGPVEPPGPVYELDDAGNVPGSPQLRQHLRMLCVRTSWGFRTGQFLHKLWFSA